MLSKHGFASLVGYCQGSSSGLASEEPDSQKDEVAGEEARVEPFLDMRDPTFRRILRAATSKFNQMICPLMATVCVRDLCMFWNDHSKSCLIADTMKINLYHAVCPKCQSANVSISVREQRSGKNRGYRCDTCGNEWGQIH
jgi:DNA-directed RNA polymerase subunit M/transcription elongation factor TFIIS